MNDVQRARVAKYLSILIGSAALGFKDAELAEFANAQYGRFLPAVSEIEAIMAAPEGQDEAVNYIDTSKLN